MTQYEIAKHLGYLIIAVSPLIILFYFLFKEPLQKPYTEDDWHRDQDEYYLKAHLAEERKHQRHVDEHMTDSTQELPKHDIRKLPEF